MDVWEFSPDSLRNSSDSFDTIMSVMCHNEVDSLLTNQDNDNVLIVDRDETQKERKLEDVREGSLLDGQHLSVCLEQQPSYQTGSNASGNSEFMKRNKRKRVKEEIPVHTIITRSETDSLDDGYKWRKYGKKRIKNSSQLRSYYRCSDCGCGVTKRVERDNNDTDLVITRYEGIHNHECPRQQVMCYVVKPIFMQQPGSKPIVVLINEGSCSS